MTTIFESRMFKSVSGGYIFQLEPPTIFHSTAAYVVNEAQKAQILAIVGSRVWAIMPAWASIAAALLAGLVVGYFGGSVIDYVFVGAGAFFVMLIAVTCLGFYLKQRRLEPVLAGLPRSNERLFPKSNPKSKSSSTDSDNSRSPPV
jgi:hypothetical protein